jgi:omega-amidase
MGKFKIAVCQMQVVDDKDKNVKKAVNMLEQAAKGGASLVVLPEMFNCPYERRKFRLYAESIPDGPTTQTMAAKAKELGIVVVGGSIPEIEGDNIYNTSVVYGRDGNIMGKYRKIHLFDIDIPGKVRVVESETLTAGDSILVADLGFCKVGVVICYDMRFQNLIMKTVLSGANIVVAPGAFNIYTGEAHWELLVRTRAVDNQVFFVGASPARDMTAAYKAFGNSMVSSPWGEVIARAGIEEEIVFADIDLKEVEEVRQQLPLLQHRRTDI